MNGRSPNRKSDKRTSASLEDFDPVQELEPDDGLDSYSEDFRRIDQQSTGRNRDLMVRRAIEDAIERRRFREEFG